MTEFINFPPSFPEDEKVKFCKMLDDRDQEISKLYKEIIVLENKVERFNGGLNYSQAESLKTQMGINNAMISQVYAELAKFNLKAIQYENPKSPNVMDIKLIKISLMERFRTWLSGLIKFQIVKKSN